jgi:hypothetical protein
MLIDALFMRGELEDRIQTRTCGFDTAPSIEILQGVVRKFFAFRTGSPFPVPNS